MRHYITVFEGNEKIQTYLLNILPSFSSGRITIGRLQTNDIVLPYQSVSRSHAAIELHGDVLDMVDVGSLNKLRVNGVAYERIRLVNGLSITIGTSANTISLQYTAALEPVSADPQPEVTKTDSDTAIFNFGDLQKNAAATDTPAEKRTIISAADDVDDIWSPMPRGSSHKATPVPPLNSRESEISGEVSPQKTPNRQVSHPQQPQHTPATSQTQAQSQSQPQPQAKPQTPARPAGKVIKASTSRRFIAFMADFVICAFMVVGAAFLMLLTLNWISGIKAIALLTFIVALAVLWVYYTLGESGETGATIGKMALGLKVVDIKTHKTISAKTASKRFFAKILSAFILFIGFFPIFGKKQTFHDYISGTQVVKNS